MIAQYSISYDDGKTYKDVCVQSDKYPIVTSDGVVFDLVGGKVVMSFITWTVVDFLVASGLAKSKSDARRLIQQGGVSVDRVKVTDPRAWATPGVWQVGSRHFVRGVFNITDGWELSECSP